MGRSALVAEVRARLAAEADPARAGPMQRYLKSTLPCHGVPMPVRAPLCACLPAPRDAPALRAPRRHRPVVGRRRRQAVGWALRQHARVDPDWVGAFVAEHDDRLSGLSRREALKHL